MSRGGNAVRWRYRYEPIVVKRSSLQNSQLSYKSPPVLTTKPAQSTLIACFWPRSLLCCDIFTLENLVCIHPTVL